MADFTREQNESACRPALPGSPAATVPEHWPSDGGSPLGGVNPWFLDAAAFVALVKRFPHLWLTCNEAKYLNIRIDTRDCSFVLTGRNDEKIDMDRILQKMRENRFEGAYRSDPVKKVGVAGKHSPADEA